MDAHVPVMRDEVIHYLKPEAGKLIVDCTLGCGGHALKILEKITPDGTLIGIDQDEEALGMAKRSLAAYKNSCKFVNESFRNLALILKDLNIDKIDGLLFDLGVSSMHFDTPSRGFSIKQNGPLDMRMDRRNKLTAETIVNRFPFQELESILREYGQEWKSRRIASLIVESRKKKPIKTTFELSRLIERVYYKKSYHWRTYPATKTFLALRIAVNDELNALKEGLENGIEHLGKGARIALISFGVKFCSISVVFFSVSSSIISPHNRMHSLHI